MKTPYQYILNWTALTACSVAWVCFVYFGDEKDSLNIIFPVLIALFFILTLMNQKKIHSYEKAQEAILLERQKDETHHIKAQKEHQRDKDSVALEIRKKKNFNYLDYLHKKRMVLENLN